MSDKDLKELQAQLPALPRERPLAYKIYNYLKENAVGYEDRIKADVLMKEFKINDNKTLRGYIQEIRESEVLTKIICSEAGKDGGYWIATDYKEVKKTLDHLYKRSMEMLKSYSMLKKKAKLDKQKRIRLSKYEKEVIESIMDKSDE